jgi:hypothetical protein
VEEPLSNAVNRKNSKFLVRCNESGVVFKEDAVDIINRIGLVQIRKRGCKPSIAFAG